MVILGSGFKITKKEGLALVIQINFHRPVDNG